MNTTLRCCILIGAFAAVPAHADPFTLDFEGIAATYPDFVVDYPLIGGYYDGGTSSNGRTGTDHGAAFSPSARAICLNTVGTTCSNVSKGGAGVPGSERDGLSFTTADAIVDVAAGFASGFALAYADPNATFPGGFQLWSGLDGSGTLIASVSLPTTTDGFNACAAYGNADYCPFSDFSTSFAGVAESVVFTGAIDAVIFDDLTFGSTDVGLVGTTVQIPEPATLALFAAACAGLGWARRRRTATIR